MMRRLLLVLASLLGTAVGWSAYLPVVGMGAVFKKSGASSCSMKISLGGGGGEGDISGSSRATGSYFGSSNKQSPGGSWVSSPRSASPSSAQTFNTEFTSECDDASQPPSLNILLRSIEQLSTAGSDIRGKFVNHARFGTLPAVAHEISRSAGLAPALTPLVAYCFGRAFALQLLEREAQQDTASTDDPILIALGRDPRTHGMRVADAFARGAESVNEENNDFQPRPVSVAYTGVATTPSMASFCALKDAHAGIMVTASHLPGDRNGIKLYTRRSRGFTKQQVASLGARAADVCTRIFSSGILPPSSGEGAIMCSQWVDWMPDYANSLKRAISSKVGVPESEKPLKGLKIVLNAGNGSGGFFRQVLNDLGADTMGSLGCEPDGNFPNGVPNPENPDMLADTVQACQDANADLGIMLDTDADRCGFAVPRTVRDDGSRSDYEPLNRNRLIALLGVLFAQESPGCAVVTDSVTSEGLASFLEEKLGLVHVRYLKGYANVINKAMEITAGGQLNAELAIETSGHCAMRENNYLDDGTYTAVKVVSLLALERQKSATASLLDIIADMPEMAEVAELRMSAKDESLETMRQVFDFCALEMEQLCYRDSASSVEDATALDSATAAAVQSWQLDTDNLEGIRISIGDGQFFMLRKSLHDPQLSLQIEAADKDTARRLVTEPLLKIFASAPQIMNAMDVSKIQEY